MCVIINVCMCVSGSNYKNCQYHYAANINQNENRMGTKKPEHSFKKSRLLCKTSFGGYKNVMISISKCHSIVFSSKLLRYSEGVTP